MKIGKRSLRQFKNSILDINNYLAALRFFQTYEKPYMAILKEVLSLGIYPCSVNIKTPIGKQELKLFSVSDFSTLNLIFCRRDYYTPEKISTVVDIGSNIGLSALYWLTRNYNSFCYCYEPSPISFKRLEENLSLFSNRYLAYKAAVSDFNGKSKLGLEESGVYSSLNLISKNFVEWVASLMWC